VAGPGGRPAGAGAARQAGQPGSAGRARPLHLIHGGALSYCARLTRPRPPATRQQIAAKRRHAADFKSRSYTAHRRRTDKQPPGPRFARTSGNTVFSGSSATGADTRSGNRPMMRASSYDPASGRRPDLGRIDGGPGREPPEPPATTPGACGVPSHTTQTENTVTQRGFTMSSMS
jgi:hypothetical protein